MVRLYGFEPGDDRGDADLSQETENRQKPAEQTQVTRRGSKVVSGGSELRDDLLLRPEREIRWRDPRGGTFTFPLPALIHIATPINEALLQCGSVLTAGQVRLRALGVGVSSEFLLTSGGGATLDDALITEGITLDQRTVTGALTLGLTDFFVACDASGGGFTVTLPDALATPGRVYVLKKIDSSTNVVTIDTTGADTIDGAATQVLGEEFRSLVLGNDGVNWFILAAERIVSQVVLGQTANISAGVTVFAGLTSNSGTSADVELPVPFAATLRNFRVRSGNAPGAAETYDFTVANNGTTGSVTAQIAGAVARTAQDLSNTEVYALGDRISIEVITSATSAALTFPTWSAELVRT